MTRFLLLLCTIGTAAATTLRAQAVPLPTEDTSPTAYRPRLRAPEGRQLVVVFFGATNCGHSRDAQLKDAVRRMKPLVARQAAALHRPLSINGVALDWAVDSGVTYLRSLGQWDEISVGNNFSNANAIRHMWRGSRALPLIPQVLVLEQVVTPGASRIAFSDETRLAEYFGTDEIIQWVDRGAPLTPHRAKPPTKRLAPGAIDSTRK